MVLDKNLANISSTSKRMLLSKHKELISSLGSYRSSYVKSISDMQQAEVFIAEGELNRGLGYLRRALLRNPFLPVRRYIAISRRIVIAYLDKLFPKSSEAS
jgi:hypothetical protein